MVSMVHRCAGRGREEAGKATHGGDGARVDEMWRVEEDEKLFKVPDVSAHHFLDEQNPGRLANSLLSPQHIEPIVVAANFSPLLASSLPQVALRMTILRPSFLCSLDRCMLSYPHSASCQT